MNAKAKELGKKRVHPALEVELSDPRLRHYGLTLREHLAGLAMQALLANPAWAMPSHNSAKGPASSALWYADELLEELTKDAL